MLLAASTQSFIGLVPRPISCLAGQLKLSAILSVRLTCAFVSSGLLLLAVQPVCYSAQLQATSIMLRQFVNTGFQVLFHSPPGVLFTFPSQYYALSVTKEYLALRGGPRSFHQGSTCLNVLWILLLLLGFRVRGFHPLSPVFPVPFH